MLTLKDKTDIICIFILTLGIAFFIESFIDARLVLPSRVLLSIGYIYFLIFGVGKRLREIIKEKKSKV